MTDEKISVDISDNSKGLFKAVDGVELIQQWQYVGEVHPNLLENEAFEYAKQAGLTSVQSYVTWAEIEKEPNKIDFSSYDILVDKLAKHKLKWVPFLILGPYYATPKWFLGSNGSICAKCLEHNKESKIQSIWNPHLPKYVDRFLQLIAEHYQDKDIFESIGLGISGNWGEAIYPANGGFYKGFHTHPGFWCGDKYAISNFRRFAIEKYKSIEELNSAWDTNFRDIEEINFPRAKTLRLESICCILNKIPRQIKTLLKPAGKRLFDIFRYKRVKKPWKQQKWIDFVNWYLISMTNWAEFWVKTARKYFPKMEIYLVTGGHGLPQLGADFSAQTKMVSKYKAGIRITNQTDDYNKSFIYTRLVSSASRFYGSYFTTEEATINCPNGITARLFDVATSGAKGAYFKSVIGTGTDLCTGKTFTLGKSTQGAINLANNLHYLTLSQPIIEVAILFPNTSIALDTALISSIYTQCSELRDAIDFDLVDENMIADGALKKYRFLVIIECSWLCRDTLMEIQDWVIRGGTLIFAAFLKISAIDVDDDNKEWQGLFTQRQTVKRNGGGYTVLFTGRRHKYLDFITKAVYNQDKKYPYLGIPEIDGKIDRVYATQLIDNIIYYNSSNVTIRKNVEIGNLPYKSKFEINIAPHSIAAVQNRGEHENRN